MANNSQSQQDTLHDAKVSFQSLFETIGPFLTIGTILVAWEITARLELVIPYLLPAFSVVIERIGEDLLSGTLITNLGLTLYRAMAGFAIAAVVGMTIGILMSEVSLIRWFFDPLVSIGLPLPKIALLPIFILWFGPFDATKIFMVAFSAVFTVIIATYSGARSIDKNLLWSAQSLGANKRQIIWEILMPGALPQTFTGLQIAMPICLIVTLVCEMVMGGRGLGDEMIANARYADSPGVFAGIVEIAVCGFAIIKAMDLVRGRILSWHPETEKNATA